MATELQTAPPPGTDYQAPWSVLVVARGLSSARALGSTLREAGFEVDETDDPDVAAALAGRRDVIAVVLEPRDLSADAPPPGLLELITRMRTAPASTGASILAWLETGVPVQGAVRALAAGADGQLPESAETDLVVATVRSLAQRGATAREQADRGGIAESAMYMAPVVGIMALDEQLHVVAHNQRLRRMGVLADMVLGRSVSEAVTGELGAHVQELASRALGAGVEQDRHVTISVDGRERHWELRAFEVAAPSGRVRGLEVVLEDVTEAERMLEQLRVGEQRWRAVFDAEGIGVSLRDRDARLIECNEAYARMYDAPSPAALKGTTFRDVLSDEDAELAHRVFAERWGRMHTLVGDERTHRLRSGRDLVVSASMCNIYDADGTPLARLSLTADITERRRLERELSRAQRMEAIGRLAGGVAHDVNNMLAVIIGYSEIISRRLGAGHELQTELAEIRRAAEHSRSLASDLLAFGRQQALERRPVVLGEVVGGLRSLLRHTLPETIELMMEDLSAGAVAHGDRAQLETVVVNLVANARDAMSGEGSVTVRTEVLPPTPQAPDGTVSVSVCDTGAGMADDVRERIFEPFFTTKERGKGAGLGLATVAGIVEQMGGAVAVESRPGEGSTFRVTLPRVNGESPEAAASPPAAATPAAAPARRTVLVVEDQEQVRRMVARLLDGIGYEVVSVACAEEALALVADRTRRLDLLLTDMILPDISGGELAGRALELRPELRVVYTSGYTGEQVVRDGMPAGHGFVGKPYGVDELQRTLEAAFGEPPAH